MKKVLEGADVGAGTTTRTTGVVERALEGVEILRTMGGDYEGDGNGWQGGIAEFELLTWEDAADVILYGGASKRSGDEVSCGRYVDSLTRASMIVSARRNAHCFSLSLSLSLMQACTRVQSLCSCSP